MLSKDYFIILEIVDKIPITNNLKAKFLLTLKFLIKVGSEVIKENQTYICNSITRLQTRIIPLEDSKNMDMITTQIQNYQKEYENQLNDKKLVNLPSEIDYLISLMNVLASACEDKNVQTESRCQSIMPLKILRDLYMKSGVCWSLKMAILFYLYHVYFDTEIEMDEEQLIVYDIIRVIFIII